MARISSASERCSGALAGSRGAWRCWPGMLPDHDASLNLDVASSGQGHQHVPCSRTGHREFARYLQRVDGSRSGVSEAVPGIGQLDGADRLIPGLSGRHGFGQPPQRHGRVRFTGDGLTSPARNPGVYLGGHVSRVSRNPSSGHDPSVRGRGGGGSARCAGWPSGLPWRRWKGQDRHLHLDDHGQFSDHLATQRCWPIGPAHLNDLEMG